MKWYRVSALVARQLTLLWRDTHRLIDVVYWSLLDILIFGFTGAWIEQGDIPHAGLMMLTALVLWQWLVRVHLELALGLLDEFWSHNIINLFASPLKPVEWACACMIMGLFRGTFVVVFGATAIWLIYDLVIFKAGLILIPCLVSLLLSGWCIGLVTVGLLLHWGQKVQSLVWIMAWAFSPLSAVFYPLSVLPSWAQQLAQLVPMMHVFEALRGSLLHGNSAWNHIAMSFGLNCIYLLSALRFVTYMYDRSTERGLARLERFE